jgi:hypothetical protein
MREVPVPIDRHAVSILVVGMITHRLQSLSFARLPDVLAGNVALYWNTFHMVPIPGKVAIVICTRRGPHSVGIKAAPCSTSFPRLDLIHSTQSPVLFGADLLCLRISFTRMATVPIHHDSLAVLPTATYSKFVV